jgi:hypothetical protein
MSDCDDDKCRDCDVHDCPGNPRLTETMQGISDKLSKLTERDGGLKEALEHYDTHLKAAKVLADLFKSKVHPTDLARLSFKITLGIGGDGKAGERVFQVDDVFVPMIGVFRMFDPFFRAMLAAIEEFSSRLESMGAILNAVEAVNSRINEMMVQEQLDKDPSEMN